MRLPKPSSASVPTIACSGTPAWRVRVPISPTSLPCSVCSSSLPSPVTTARGARMRVVEVERVEDRTARPARARRRGRPTGRRRARRRRRSSARRAGRAGTSAASSSSRSLEPLDHLRVGALLRPEHLGAALQRRAHVAQHDDLRAAQPAGVLDRLQRARAAVGRRRAADRDEDHLRAALHRGGDQLAGAVGGRRPGVALVLGDEAEARSPPPSRRSPCRRPRPARSRPAISRPSGSCTARRRSLAAEVGSSASSVPSPPSATGHRSGGIRPARSSPRPIAPATCGGAEGALERVGRDEHGTLGDGHGRIVSGLPRGDRVRDLRARRARGQALQPGQGLLPRSPA